MTNVDAELKKLVADFRMLRELMPDEEMMVGLADALLRARTALVGLQQKWAVEVEDERTYMLSSEDVRFLKEHIAEALNDTELVEVLSK